MVKHPCTCCEIADALSTDGRIYPIGDHWTVNSRVDHARPALVVQTRQHRSSLASLDPPELQSLGAALEAASRAVEAYGDVERVYVCMFNEGRPGHVHFHVVPRFANDSPPLVGSALPDLPPNAFTFDAERAAANASTSTSVRAEPSILVRGVRRTSQVWDRRLSLYRVARNLSRRGHLFDAAEIYLIAWLMVWGVFCLWSSAVPNGRSDALFVGLAMLATYRGLDAGLYEAEVLLKMEPSALKSVPRAMLLRAGNLLEIVLAVGALLQLEPGLQTGAALLAGYKVVTLQTEFGLPGAAGDAVLVASGSLALLLLVGGIAMLLGKIADTFYEG